MSVSIDALACEVPRWVAVYADSVIAARGRPERLKRVLHRTPVPIVLVDEARRFVDANTPALLAVRLNLEQLRGLRVDDLTPEDYWPVLEDAWNRLITTGYDAGPSEVASPAETRLEVGYYALAEVLPGIHLVAFAPASWPERELIRSLDLSESHERAPLTPRELEVLELAAEGEGVRQIAAELVVSPSTVRTHFEHIYSKLGVRDRAAAVAKAMRLGLIA